jgi:hypothetical protein
MYWAMKQDVTTAIIGNVFFMDRRQRPRSKTHAAANDPNKTSQTNDSAE